MSIKKTFLFVILALLGSFVVGCSSKSYTAGVGHFSVPETARFKPPQPREMVLDNGLTVLFLEDKELPLIEGTLILKVGSWYEPETLAGVTSATMDGMRAGGAGQYGAEDLDRVLETMAASISSAGGQEFSSVSFSCLSGDVEKVFSLFGDVVQKPRFENARFNLWKQQALESIRRRKDDPVTVAGLSFNQILLSGSPLGKVVTSKEISALKRQNVIALHQQLVGPRGAILSISGNIDEAAVRKLVEKTFGNWKPQVAKLTQPPLPRQKILPSVVFIQQPLAQATIVMGQRGPKRFQPDFVALDIFNEIFGVSSFGSRLARRVRAEQGLAYAVYGAITPGTIVGKNQIYIQTKVESAGEAVNAAIKEIVGMQDSSALPELAETKRGIANSFVFKFTSPAAVVNREASLRLLDYPAQFDQTYLENIEQTSAEEIFGVAKKHWRLDDLVIVVVGNEKALEALERERDRPDSAIHRYGIRSGKFNERLELQ